MVRNLHDRVAVVIPNWNGEDSLIACLDSVQNQSLKPHIMVVDNGSKDNSVAIISQSYPDIELIQNNKNEGYTGGVNPGFLSAIELKYEYVAPFNNDAIADKHWLKFLVAYLDAHPQVGIAACKILSADGKHLDSTGESYTTWGLSYPRGRGEADLAKYDKDTSIFGASGGASLYRVNMLQEIGILDHDYFAYYEDVDISFRAQLAGWRVAYVPQSKVYHEISATGARIKGFFTYQTMKNLPILFWKNVPFSLMPTILPRFAFVYVSFFVSAAMRGQLRYAIQGSLRALSLMPKKLWERRHIQKTSVVNSSYIASIITWDLPPNAQKLRLFRNTWRRFLGKSVL